MSISQNLTAVQEVNTNMFSHMRTKTLISYLKLDEQVKRVWTIDGSFHCIVMEGNVEVKKRLDSPDNLFKLGWSEKIENSGLFSHH